MLEWLKSFVAAVEAGGFREAARRRGITQSALSKQIQALENTLGTRLLDRARNGTRPTDIGQALVPSARRVLGATQDLLDEARALQQGTAGVLRVGFGTSSIVLAPREVARFRLSHPAVDVCLTDMSSSRQIEGVLSGELHAGFTRLPVPDGVGSYPVEEDSLAVASLGETGSPNPESLLANHPLIRLASAHGPGLSAQIDQWSRMRKLQLTALAEADDLQTVLAFVASGAGPAIVPASAARIAPPEVVITPLDGPYSAWTIGLIWNSNECTPTTRAFVKSCLTVEYPAP